MKMFRLAAVLAAALLASASTGCRSTSPVRTESAYTLVFLHGATPAPELSDEDRDAAMAGHFSNMAVLAEQGKLLVAGPLGPPRSVASHRGIFLLNTGDVEEARQWTGTDPSIGAGIFVIEPLACRSRAALERIVPLDDAAIERRMEEDATLTRDTAWQGRAYVLASAQASAERSATAASLEASGGALITMQVASAMEGERWVSLEGGGDARPLAEDKSELWVVLDAEDVDQARALLGEDAAAWTLHGWYATTVLPELKHAVR